MAQYITLRHESAIVVHTQMALKAQVPFTQQQSNRAMKALYPDDPVLSRGRGLWVISGRENPYRYTTWYGYLENGYYLGAHSVVFNAIISECYE